MPTITNTNKQKLPYYQINKVLSFNGVYNFIVGGRGLGKTYGFTTYAIRKALNTITDGEQPDQFIYLRRFKTEIVASRQTFFAAIQHQFPGWEFAVTGNTATAKRRGTAEKPVTIGYFLALSNAQTLKSVAYPHVKTIIFDEFILEEGFTRYLPDEATAFNNFYSTVDRYKDKTRVFFLANSVSVMNPYFLEYEIMPDQLPEFSKHAGGFIVCHFPDSKDFQNKVYQTRFGKFISGTDYADYAVGNTFHDNHDGLIDIKPPTAQYRYSLETKDISFSVWRDGETYYIQQKLPAKNIWFTIVPENMSSGKIFLHRSDRILQRLRRDFSNGNIFFDKPSTRNAFVKIAK